MTSNLRRALARFVTSFVAVVLLTTVTAVTVVASAPPAGATTSDTQALYQLTNQARQQAGLPPLQWDDGLAAIAQVWTVGMATVQSLSHNSLLAAQISAQVTNAWTLIGENVGYAGSPTDLQDAFMSSSGHRANILGNYNRVGIGTVRDASGTVWATVDFLSGPPLPVNNPRGHLDAAAQAPGGIRVQGWALDPDTTSPIVVHTYVDSAGTNIGYASGNRPDVAAVFPTYGAAHGFDAVVPAGPGWHWVCSYGINVGSGVNSLLGCQAVFVASNPIGWLELATQAAGGIRVAGWAMDPETSSPIVVHTYIDSQGWNIGQAAGNRFDVAAVFPGYGAAHGFDTLLPATPGWHTVCSYGINVGYGANALLGCRPVFVSTTPVGNIDVAQRVDARHVHVVGWALDPQTSAPVNVLVAGDGFSVNLGPANDIRNDVAAVFWAGLYGAAHGFDDVIAVPTGATTVCAYAVSATATTPLRCRPIS